MSDRVAYVAYQGGNYHLWVGNECLAVLFEGEARALHNSLAGKLEPCSAYEFRPDSGLDLLACASCARPGWEHLTVRVHPLATPRAWLPAEDAMLRRLKPAS